MPLRPKGGGEVDRRERKGREEGKEMDAPAFQIPDYATASYCVSID